MDTRWVLVALLAAAAFFLWLNWDDLMSVVPSSNSGDLQEGATADPPSEPEATSTHTEVRTLQPPPPSHQKIYTGTDIERLDRKTRDKGPNRKVYTNEDLQKYHQRPPTGDIERMRKEIEWAEEPTAKKPFTRRKNP